MQILMKFFQRASHRKNVANSHNINKLECIIKQIET